MVKTRRYHGFLAWKISLSYLVLKQPSLEEVELFQSFHFCCFSLLISSTCAFLWANFIAFILFFLLFFTFQGSFGRIFSFSGTLNSSVTYSLVSSTFSLGLAMGRSRCSLTISCELYFLYLTRQPSSITFSTMQGQNSPSPEQMALQCVPYWNSSASGSFRTFRRQAGSSSTQLEPYLLILAVCSSTSTSWTTEFFHLRSSWMKHFANLPMSPAVSSSMLRGQALVFFSFSLKMAISSLRATSMFSFIALSSSFSSSCVSSREIRRLILASDFLSSMMEAQWSRMVCELPSSSSRASYLLFSGCILLLCSLIFYHHIGPSLKPLLSTPPISPNMSSFPSLPSPFPPPYQGPDDRLIHICNIVSMSTAGNPFKLQTDNKKFFFDVVSRSALEVIPEYSKAESGANRIKNMGGELQELAKRREEMLFKDSEINYIFKKEKPVMQLGEFLTSVAQGSSKEKKFRVRALLKEKKESVHEFLQKKKEIYLSKMNINIKKEQTTKLEDAIKDEEETLKARKLYFENDVEFMHKFIEGIKKQAEEAQNAVENELKIQESLVSKLNGLEAETEKIDNSIAKDTETLNNLKTYKEFIDSFYDEERNWKPYQRRPADDSTFLTENALSQKEKDSLTIRYQPHNLLEIFNNAEENNIREIQNLHDKEDEVEVITKAYNKLVEEVRKVKEEGTGRIAVLEKTLERKTEEHNKLKELKKNNINKINIFDNENIDLEKVANKVLEIFKEVNSKKAVESMEGASEKVMKKAMTEIEHEIERLRLAIKREKELHPQLIMEVEKEIKENQKRENLIRKKEEAKELELKKQREQEKKRNEPPSEMVKGRRDMQKVILEKKVAKKKEVDVKTIDESEKYFTND